MNMFIAYNLEFAVKKGNNQQHFPKWRIRFEHHCEHRTASHDLQDLEENFE